MLAANSINRESTLPRVIRKHPGTSRVSTSKINPRNNVRIRRVRQYAGSEATNSLPRPRLLSFNLVFAVLIFVLLLGKLFIRLEILDKSYRIESIRNEILLKDSYLRELKAKKAIHANPRELIRKAGKELDLQATMPQQIRRIN